MHIYWFYVFQVSDFSSLWWMFTQVFFPSFLKLLFVVGSIPAFLVYSFWCWFFGLFLHFTLSFQMFFPSSLFYQMLITSIYFSFLVLLISFLVSFSLIGFYSLSYILVTFPMIFVLLPHISAVWPSILISISTSHFYFLWYNILFYSMIHIGYCLWYWYLFPISQYLSVVTINPDIN